MISPSSLAVFALKFLQKSMMFTPCGPSAVPTGGAGVALPAAIWSFTIAWTFLAMASIYFSTSRGASPPRGTDADASRLCRSAWPQALDFLDLQKIQFHWRRPSEDRHHDLERVLVQDHFVHDTVEAGERPLVD